MATISSTESGTAVGVKGAGSEDGMVSDGDHAVLATNGVHAPKKSSGSLSVSGIAEPYEYEADNAAADISLFGMWNAKIALKLRADLSAVVELELELDALELGSYSLRIRIRSWWNKWGE